MARLAQIWPALALAAASGAAAQPIDVEYTVPTLDRWNYPFNASPGTRIAASVFGVPNDATFDDRDAQFLIGFDTGDQVPPEKGAASYTVTEATLTLTTITGGVFAYDPSTDPFQTYLLEDHPDFQSDADAGRPVELFGVGFRNGFTIETWMENSPFQQAPFGNWQGTRNAFATDYQMEEPRDVSRHVELEFEPSPFAVGVNEALTPGATVAANTTFTFTLDLANPDVVAYLQEALDIGKLRLMATSIHPAPVMGQGAQTGLAMMAAESSIRPWPDPSASHSVRRSRHR